MFLGWERRAVVLVDWWCPRPDPEHWVLGRTPVILALGRRRQEDQIKVISSYPASLRPATDVWDSDSKEEKKRKEKKRKRQERKTTFRGSKVSEGWALSIMHCREYQSVGRKKSLLKIKGKKKENPLRFQLMKTMFRTLKRGWRGGPDAKSTGLRSGAALFWHAGIHTGKTLYSLYI